MPVTKRKAAAALFSFLAAPAAGTPLPQQAAPASAPQPQPAADAAEADEIVVIAGRPRGSA